MNIVNLNDHRDQPTVINHDEIIPRALTAAQYIAVQQPLTELQDTTLGHPVFNADNVRSRMAAATMFTDQAALQAAILACELDNAPDREAVLVRFVETMSAHMLQRAREKAAELYASYQTASVAACIA